MTNLYPRICLLLLVLLGVRPAAQAQIEPAAQYTTLTPAQLMAWTATGPTAVPANVSTVPLATRQNALAPQLNPAQSFSAKVNWCPDGMNNFSGYLNEQPQFNLYNFTHWQYVDVLTWFASPIGIPCRPWVETAHRNGVKIIGTVFTDRAGFVALCQKDASGNYLGAQKLVDVANYYGFDGWFFNEESALTATEAGEVINLLKQLQALKPAGMEIHWYDSMLPSGAVSYQNTLNANNARLLQDGTARVNDAMFTNYFWTGAGTFNTAVSTAASLGRSPFDVYTGADIWPGRNPQRLFTNTSWLSDFYTGGSPAQPRTSLAVFAPNMTFNGGQNNFSTNPADYANFYRTEQRLFSGDDLDVTTTDATGWQGFGQYLPVRSVINTLPFDTYFSVGQGQVFANNGAQVRKPWTDMAKQSLLPSWQWAKTGSAPITASFDFDRAYYAGNSIKLAGSLSGTNAANVKLYQTKLAITAPTKLDITYKAAGTAGSATRLALYFSDNLTTPALLDLPVAADTLWHTTSFPLAAYAARELAIIGVDVSSNTAVRTYRLNLGRLSVYNNALVTTKPTANFTADATTVVANQPVTFANSSTNATSFVWTFAGGTPATSTDVNPVVRYAAAGTYAVKLRAQNAVGRDSLTRTAYIRVVTPPAAGSNTALLFDGVGKYVDAGVIALNPAGFSLECWVKANSFKTGSPFISSVIGMEDGGVNNAQIRLGDANITGDRPQFVMNTGTLSRKLTSATTLTAGTWYHLAATYDGAAMRLYINGVLNASLNATTTPTVNAAFSFGRNYASSRCLDGSIDEVRVWQRALTAAEILANACDVPANAPGLEGYWKLNEATGQVANDLTGHGHTGNLIGMNAADWSANVPTACPAITAVLPGRATAGLQLQVLGNPVPGRQAEVEISGAQGQPVVLTLCNLLGAVVWQQRLSGPRTSVPVPAAAGLYILRASTPTQTTSAKLERQ
ncbi:endo-beta-N-acetylglucosaminidase [Hymenobacter armeniacus]|uniref:PKD domain-containing protein n=1 Tax=Hymenobacter armeniacus TaxID=2771358 RepID=A0ABR8JUL5_9BACT|nr:LamG-like jellyroll fold domain-containing protein [Hymenobacter armeniacus]MBD2722668.1 PKD domain-containing protein [Hymenobacter armeniacus]